MRNELYEMVDSRYDPKYFYQFRLILIGDSTVGKSSLLRQFTEGQFIQSSDPTVGVDFHVRIVHVSGKSLELERTKSDLDVIIGLEPRPNTHDYSPGPDRDSESMLNCNSLGVAELRPTLMTLVRLYKVEMANNAMLGLAMSAP